MPRWRLFYADGSTFDDAAGAPFEAPGTGLVAIVVADAEVGRLVLTDAHYYAWEPTDAAGAPLGWVALGRTDTISAGLVEYLARRGPRKVVFGTTVANASFSAILQRALTDPDFAEKSAEHAVERVNA